MAQRLIDADALKNSIDEHVYLVHHGFNETEYGCTQYGIHQIIDDAPTIDAVPVIRCKDCKHRDEETANCTRFRKDWYVQSNSFCSWAERRGEGWKK